LATQLEAVDKALRDHREELRELEDHRAVDLFQVKDGDNTIYETAEWRRAGLSRATDRATGDSGSKVRSEEDGCLYWFERSVARTPNGTVRVTVAVNGEDVERILSNLLATLAISVPFALGLAILGGYILAGRSLAPVDAMATKAHEITAERLSERLPLENPEDEFGRLARAFNDALERLEDSFEQLRRFTAHASHELRTPLTAIRSVGEVALERTREPSAYQEVIGSMLEEADRLARLVDNLLTLTRADAGRIHLNREKTDLGSLVREVSDCLRVLAEEKNQSLKINVRNDVVATVDRVILRQAVLNVLDNAIRYTPSDGTIAVNVRKTSEREAVIETADSGPGIPPEHRDRIFERFYRVQHEGADPGVGAGLGLAIARWAVEINGGRISCDSEAGRGSSFRIALPLSGKI
jgi:heavy metal sensor kinase